MGIRNAYRSYVFNHKGVLYRWSLPLETLRCPRVSHYATISNHRAFKSVFEHLKKPGPQLVIDSNDTFVAQFHPNLLKKGKPYLEVSPDGMAMLDHIVVTFIPVEVQRRKG